MTNKFNKMSSLSWELLGFAILKVKMFTKVKKVESKNFLKGTEKHDQMMAENTKKFTNVTNFEKVKVL